MAIFSLSISLDNAAFEDSPESEVARILRLVADRITSAGLPDSSDQRPVHDINGNRVGRYYTTDNGRA